ncbi:MAG: hypothetical protein EAZ57_04900 [Cytophagales bacterium]|nr:MAG: hypothetical protein EAZ67_00980 [Cytophagales bacterium]TAF61131.1 MAG: hypothetical protein EAZ57_04900 [Cytophagales bacterium]
MRIIFTFVLAILISGLVQAQQYTFSDITKIMAYNPGTVTNDYQVKNTSNYLPDTKWRQVQVVVGSEFKDANVVTNIEKIEAELGKGNGGIWEFGSFTAPEYLIGQFQITAADGQQSVQEYTLNQYSNNVELAMGSEKWSGYLYEIKPGVMLYAFGYSYFQIGIIFKKM